MKNSSATDIISRVITVVLHPLLMPVYCTLLVLYTPTPYADMPMSLNARILGSVGLFACLIPLVFIGLFIAIGQISDIEMPTHSERVHPLMLSSLAIGCSVFLIMGSVPRPVTGMLIGEAVALFAASICSIFWKVSLHAIGAGCLLSYVWVVGTSYHQDFTPVAVVAFIVAGVSAWTRLYEEAHTPAQIITGYVMGAVVMFLILNQVMLRPIL